MQFVGYKDMTKILLKNGGYLEITEKQKERWQVIYENINVEEQLAEIEYVFNNSIVDRKTEKGTLKYINFYLKNINSFYDVKRNYE